MATFGRSDELKEARFVDVNLRGARFLESDLSEVVMRGIDARNMDIDAPWISDKDSYLRVNGVDVSAFVEAELDRRFPGRSQRRAQDPEGLRSAWAAVEATWASTLERAAAMPAGSVDVSVDGEWSFAQTLRHLVHGTDMWMGRAILELDRPFHPIGQAYTADEAGSAPSAIPPYAEVLEVRADRLALVRDFIASVTPEELDAARKNPHSPARPETVRSCLHVLLDEAWEHHRFAVRDLDAIEARSDA
ncbi:DinB family protein [Kribbella sp. NPDC051952]|uniref:DinB family protein n=1 Tax=Kribbella sp. NPDC051952 TaxID=3154851 RepID=UPI003444F935